LRSELQVLWIYRDLRDGPCFAKEVIMNDTRNGKMKASAMIKGSVIGALALSVLGACSAAPDPGQGKADVAAEGAIGTQATCTTCGGDPIDPPAPRTYTAPPRITATTCPGVNSTCSLSGTYPLANDASNATWTSFQNQLSGLSCRPYSVEFYDNTSSTRYARRTVCAQSAGLTNLINATAGTSQDASACDTCIWGANAGYTWVTWDVGMTPTQDTCPGGCGRITPAPY
jgi:hypothetical protein